MTHQTAHDYCLQQIENAQHGRADNQCPTCGVYRTDGQPPPPAVHRAACRTTTDPTLTPAFRRHYLNTLTTGGTA
jgi:hypothetical protein